MKLFYFRLPIPLSSSKMTKLLSICLSKVCTQFKHDFSCLFLSLYFNFFSFSFVISLENNGIVKLFLYLPIFLVYPSSSHTQCLWAKRRLFLLSCHSTLQMFTGIYGGFIGKSECGDFKFMGIACYPQPL